MKRIAEWVFGVAGLLLLTVVAVNFAFVWISMPSDVAVLAGVAVLAMTASAWAWIVTHFYHTWRGYAKGTAVDRAAARWLHKD